MITVLLAFLFSGDISSQMRRDGPLSVTKVFDAQYGVVCYSMAEAYRGIVGFSCVKVTKSLEEDEVAVKP